MRNRLLTWVAVFALLLALILLVDFASGRALQGQAITWLIFVAIGAVVIFIIYFATSDNRAWEVGTREVVYMALGAALYGVLSVITNTIPMPSVSQVALRPPVVIPIFFGYVFGPVVGFFTGAFGNIIGDFLSGWGVYPAWDMGNGLMGFIPGLVLLFADRKRSLNTLLIVTIVLLAIFAGLVFLNPQVVGPWTGELEDFSFWSWAAIIAAILVIAGRFVLESVNLDVAAAEIWGSLGVIVGIGFAAIADIWINGYSFMTAIIGEFMPAAVPNILNMAILLPILMVAYYAVVGRTGR
ncbi:MAG: ECF transporter S component [Anaerolineales bacterium]|nr:MAG: ECF transporter S component [Anaerolineales bacterium]